MFTNVSPTPDFYFTFTVLVLNPLIVGDGNLKVMAHNNVQVGILLAFHCINIRLFSSADVCYLYRQHPAKNTIKKTWLGWSLRTDLCRGDLDDYTPWRFCDWDWKMPFAPANKSTIGYSSLEITMRCNLLAKTCFHMLVHVMQHACFSSFWGYLDKCGHY